MSERVENIILNEAKNVSDAVVSVRLFNAEQNNIFLLQPFDC